MHLHMWAQGYSHTKSDNGPRNSLMKTQTPGMTRLPFEFLFRVVQVTPEI